MNLNAANVIHEVTTRVTVCGGFITWVAANSSVLTLLVFACTGVASIVCGIVNARTNKENAKANTNRNKINKREITESIINELKESGKSNEYIKDLKELIRD